MPQKSWAVGEEVLAADFNTYVQQQVVPAFANVTTRDSQWTAPPNGALSVTTDTNTLWQRIQGVWQAGPSGGAELGYAQNVGGGQSIGATETDITGLSVAVTIPAARKLLIESRTLFTASAAGAVPAVFLRYGGTTGATGTAIGQQNQSSAVATHWLAFNVAARISGSAGTYTFRATAAVNTGTLTSMAGPAFPMWLQVIDLGG